MATPAVPGAINVAAPLVGTEIVAIATSGPESAQTTVSAFAAFVISNAAKGTFVANGATPVTVAAPRVTAASAIIITLKTVGGTVGAIPAIQTITASTGFTVAGTASDTSTYNYFILG